MSGSLADLLARPVGIDVLTPLGKMAEIENRNQQTALVQQQARGAELANALAALRLGIRSTGAAGFLGQGGAVPGVPALPGAPAAAPGGAGAPGGSGGGMLGTLAGGAPQQPQNYGVAYGGVNFPPDVASSIWEAENRGEAFNKALDAQRTRYMRAFGSPDWARGIQQLYREGWVSPQDAQWLLANPQSRERMIQAMQSPEQWQSMVQGYVGKGAGVNPQTGQVEASPTAQAIAGGLAEATAGGHGLGDLKTAEQRAAAAAKGAGQFKTVTVTMPHPTRPGDTINATVQESELPDVMGTSAKARATTAADHFDPNVTISPQVYSQRVVMRESGGNAGAQSTTSTAGGAAQFTDDTWKETVRAAKPDWARGMTDDQLMAARRDPGKSREMAYARAQMNARSLEGNGLPVSSWSLGLAHFLGGGGAVGFLNAPASAKASDAVSEAALKANPWLKGKTVGDVISGFQRDYGNNRVDLSRPFAAAAQPVAQPGVILGQRELSPEGKRALEVRTQQVAKDNEAVTAAQGNAESGRVAQTQLLQTRDLIPQINTGAGAETLQKFQNVFATYAPDALQQFIAAATAGKIDPTKSAATQEFVKQTLIQAGQQEQKVLGANGGYSAIQLYRNAFPSLETQPNAIRDMTNVLLVAHQRDIDYAREAQEFQEANRAAFESGSNTFNPLSAFNNDFAKRNSPQVYVAAAAALNDKSPVVWMKGLSKEQIATAMGILGRADPSALARIKKELGLNPASGDNGG